MFGYEEGAHFMVFGDPALMSFIPIFNKTQNIIGIVGGEANTYPNGDYPGNDEIDESYATYWFIIFNILKDVNGEFYILYYIFIQNHILYYNNSNIYTK